MNKSGMEMWILILIILALVLLVFIIIWYGFLSDSLGGLFDKLKELLEW